MNKKVIFIVLLVFTFLTQASDSDCDVNKLPKSLSIIVNALPTENGTRKINSFSGTQNPVARLEGGYFIQSDVLNQKIGTDFTLTQEGFEMGLVKDIADRDLRKYIADAIKERRILLPIQKEMERKILESIQDKEEKDKIEKAFKEYKGLWVADQGFNLLNMIKNHEEQAKIEKIINENKSQFKLDPINTCCILSRKGDMLTSPNCKVFASECNEILTIKDKINSFTPAHRKFNSKGMEVYVREVESTGKEKFLTLTEWKKANQSKNDPPTANQYYYSKDFVQKNSPQGYVLPAEVFVHKLKKELKGSSDIVPLDDYAFKLGLENKRELLFQKILELFPNEFHPLYAKKHEVTLKGVDLNGNKDPTGIASAWIPGEVFDLDIWKGYIARQQIIKEKQMRNEKLSEKDYKKLEDFTTYFDRVMNRDFIQRHSLLDIIMQPFDSHPAQYILADEPGQSKDLEDEEIKRQAIDIDMARFLPPGNAVTRTNGKTVAIFRGTFLNAPQAELPLDEKSRDLIKNLDVKKLEEKLNEKKLVLTNNDVEELKKKDLGKMQEEAFEKIHPSALNNMVERIKNMQEALNKNPESTPRDLFRAAYPQLDPFITFLQRTPHPPSPYGAFDALHTSSTKEQGEVSTNLVSLEALVKQAQEEKDPLADKLEESLEQIKKNQLTSTQDLRMTALWNAE